MARKARRLSRCDSWLKYSDIPDSEVITAGEGREILLKQLTELSEAEKKEYGKKFDQLIQSAIEENDLKAQGKGVKALIVAKDFFIWALTKRDKRYSPDKPEKEIDKNGKKTATVQMREAALRFEVPYPPAKIYLNRLFERDWQIQVYAYAAPPDYETARQLCMELEDKLRKVNEEVARLKEENARLTEEVEELREKFKKKQEDGKDAAATQWGKIEKE